METLFIGKNAVFLPETESTNSYAINLLKNVNIPEGTIVHTAHQTRGKGQRGSAWKSEPASNLTASVVIKPGFLNLNKQFYLYQLSALAVYDTIAQMLNSGHFDIKIKWPNDILVNNHKIAGILIETNVLNNQLNWCVAGIGINVNQTYFDGLPNATSLKNLLCSEISIDVVLHTLCIHFEKHYLALMAGKHERIISLYKEKMFGINTWRQFEVAGIQQQLKVLGVGITGLLLLETKTGEQKEFDVKEVRWLL